MQSDRRDFVVGEFRVSPMLNRIRSADKIITVKPKSMAVLERLAETPGQVVSRNDIMDRVWPGAAVTDDVLTQSIAELRRAFGDDARSPTFIETIPKVGVRLVANLKVLQTSKAVEDSKEDPTLWQVLQRRGVIRVALSYLAIAWLILQIGDLVFENMGAPELIMRVLIILAVAGFPIAVLFAWFLELTPTGIEIDHLDGAARRPRVRGIRHYTDLIIIAVALLALAIAWLQFSHQIELGAETHTIAVLPFENLSGDPDQTYIAEGTSEEILNVLAQVADLSVIARTSSFRYRDHLVDVRQIGEELGVTWILEGSMRQFEDTIRVTAQLIDARDGFHVWSENYERSLDNILDLQDEIAAAVVEELRRRIDLDPASAIAARRVHASNEAYDHYMRGKHFMNSTFAAGRGDTSIEAPGQALHHFRRAAEIAPDFAPAWAWRGMALGSYAQLSGDVDDEVAVSNG